MRLRSLIGLSTLAIATAAAAQQQDAPFVPALSQGLRQGVTLEQYLQQVMAPFRRAAGRDGVLTREAIVTLTATQETSARQQALLLLIELDADRDGTVAAAEIGAARSRPGSRTAARFAESLLTGGKESLSILDVYRNQSLPVPALGLETGVVTSLEFSLCGLPRPWRRRAGHCSQGNRKGDRHLPRHRCRRQHDHLRARVCERQTAHLKSPVRPAAGCGSPA